MAAHVFADSGSAPTPKTDPTTVTPTISASARRLPVANRVLIAGETDVGSGADLSGRQGNQSPDHRDGRSSHRYPTPANRGLGHWRDDVGEAAAIGSIERRATIDQHAEATARRTVIVNDPATVTPPYPDRSDACPWRIDLQTDDYVPSHRHLRGKIFTQPGFGGREWCLDRDALAHRCPRGSHHGCSTVGARTVAEMVAMIVAASGFEARARYGGYQSLCEVCRARG
jgi:hypothetical protein